MAFSKSDIIFSRGALKDNTDPGFSIRGHVLRWVSGGVEARRAPRFWQPLKLSHIPKEVQEEFKTKLRTFIDGDTIRRRDLLLAFAPIELVERRRADLRDQQRTNEDAFRAKASIAGNEAVRTTKDTGIGVEKISAEQFS